MSTNYKLTILYGSETGTSADLAERICHQALQKNLFVLLSSLDDYNINELVNENLVIFVCSTTGQGDPPENMNKFWKQIMKKSLPSNCFKNLNYAIIGLGDSSYNKYNFIAKKLYKRLQQLSAKPFLNICLGDDQHDLGFEATIDPWLNDFWKQISFFFNITLPEKNTFLSKYFVHVENVEKFSLQNFNKSSNYIKNAYKSEIISNERMTPEEHWQDVRLIKFFVENIHNCYEPGDILMIQPENDIETVDRFFDLFNCLNPNSLISVSNSTCVQMNLGFYLKKPCLLKDIVKCYFNLNGVPGKSFFELLSKISENEIEKEKFLDFVSIEGTDDLFSYCNRPRRTYLEVLADFPNTLKTVKLDHIFDLFPPITPRAFSIASSPLYHKNEVHIIMAVVKYKTKLVVPRKGLCTTWLSKLSNQHVNIWLKKGTMKFPDPNNNVLPKIMVGPGTGVAPFHSYILNQFVLEKSKNVLFYGGRNRDKDFFFESDWDVCKKKNLLDVYTAFSRDQDFKIYVQHRILENQEMICCNLYDLNGYFFLAGNAKNMPSGVRESIEKCLINKRNLSEDEATQYIDTMIKNKHYQLETWS